MAWTARLIQIIQRICWEIFSENFGSKTSLLRGPEPGLHSPKRAGIVGSRWKGLLTPPTKRRNWDISSSSSSAAASLVFTHQHLCHHQRVIYSTTRIRKLEHTIMMRMIIGLDCCKLLKHHHQQHHCHHLKVIYSTTRIRKLGQKWLDFWKLLKRLLTPPSRMIMMLIGLDCCKLMMLTPPAESGKWDTSLFFLQSLLITPHCISASNQN